MFSLTKLAILKKCHSVPSVFSLTKLTDSVPSMFSLTKLAILKKRSRFEVTWNGMKCHKDQFISWHNMGVYQVWYVFVHVWWEVLWCRWFCIQTGRDDHCTRASTWWNCWSPHELSKMLLSPENPPHLQLSCCTNPIKKSKVTNLSTHQCQKKPLIRAKSHVDCFRCITT